MKELVSKSFELLEEYSDRNVGVEKYAGSVMGAIISLETRLAYENPEDYDENEVVVEILERIYTGHYLTNGNKRLAIIMATLYLDECGRILLSGNEGTGFSDEYTRDFIVDAFDKKLFKNIVEILFTERNINSFLMPSHFKGRYHKQLKEWVKRLQDR